MQKSHPSDEPRRDSAKALILHMGDVEEIDASYVFLRGHGLMRRAVSILQELTKAYTESGVGVHFAHLRPAHMSLFELVGIAEQVSLESRNGQHMGLTSIRLGILTSTPICVRRCTRLNLSVSELRLLPNSQFRSR